MKCLFLTMGVFCFSLFFSLPLIGQNRGVNYQAVARDAGNNLMQNQNLNVQFMIREGNSAGNIVYQESHATMTNSYGLFNLVIGEGNASVGSFNTIVWNSDRHFLEVLVNGASLGVQEMQSVPYSQVATSMQMDDLMDVNTGTAQIQDVLQWNGSEWRPGSLNIPSPIWAQSSNNATYGGDVYIGGGTTNADASSEHVRIRAQSENWYLGALNEGTQGASDFFIGLSSTGDGIFHIENNGSVGIGTNSPTSRLSLEGNLRGLDNSNTRFLLTAGTNTGRGIFYGPNSSNISLNNLSNNADRGFITARNETGNERASLFAGNGNQGIVRTYGSNGSLNFLVSNHSSSTSRGYAGVYDAAGNIQAGMYVNGSAQGILFADQKNFRIPHPEQADKEIWYCSLEGPEAAAYARGTGQVVNGKASIAFPDHFRLVANPATLTLILTPLSGQSKGLAVVGKTAEGFEVEELFSGQGSYSFDWEVKGVRKGHENYELIRDDSDIIPSGMEDKPEGE